METTEEIYYKLKAECDTPVACIMYVTLDDGAYNFNAMNISFREDDLYIGRMADIAALDNFHCFMNSEKGRKFYDEKYDAIKNAWTGMSMQLAGFGDKICKN